jgi:hypothetical protein
MVYALLLNCSDKIDASGRVKKVLIKLEWMDPPGLLWKPSDVTAVDNSLKVSIWTQSQILKESDGFYPGVCRWMFRAVSRIRFLKNEFGIYSMELFERRAGAESQIQNAYLHCTAFQNRGLVQFTPDVLRTSFSLWQERLRWNIVEDEKKTFTACQQLLPSARNDSGPHSKQSRGPVRAIKSVRFAVDS